MNKRQNKNKRRLYKSFLIIPLTLLLLLSASFGVYAWWDSRRAQKNIKVDVGESVTLTMSGANLGDAAGKSLVPQGALLGPNDITVIIATFNLTIDKQLANDATVKVTLVNPDNNLFVLDYELNPGDGKINFEKPVNLTVSIRLVDNARTIDYDDIKGEIKNIKVIVFIE